MTLAKLFIATLAGLSIFVSAATQDPKCVNAGGICQATTSSCDGGYVTNYCPSSGDSIKCCVPTNDAKCKGIGGTCKFTSTGCSKGFLTNYCPSGGDGIKCCPPSGGGGSGQPCSPVPKTRAGIVAAALWAHNTGTHATYTQGAGRWSGIDNHICPHSGIPPKMDCSSFVTWVYWSAFGNGADLLNGESWNAGYTGTLKDHGTAVSLSNAQVGDLVFYENPAHVTILVDKSPAQVVSFGSSGPVNLLNINYRTVSQIRRYNLF
ncbi:uncharacterized protein EV422DRAFT_306828 [Fimicolochytrium jonesii]|uniref:uncharacterized protein n=1 Tax=Fimicolochytrium jonesii TaxID=1396493 RepID=UPI0022FE7A05|nr:uncharacterized protein EV422DRAFT_306828 [Fimicolochytrium jonesii]KAI8824106.1 hypothetical protein EV422DRAFT_306828 [Fimicolochytrium jonesii]